MVKSQADRWSFLVRVAHGLRKEPAYLLMFGISSLFFVFAIALGAASLAWENWRTGLLSFGSFVSALLAATATVWMVERSDQRPREVQVKTCQLAPEFESFLAEFQETLISASAVNNIFFRSALLDRLNEFRGTLEHWTNGQLYLGPDDSKGFLLKIYETAQNEVFATSAKSFFEIWSTPFGRKILAANQAARITVTRVFVFDKPDEVGPGEVEEIRRHEALGIRVRLYFDGEDNGYKLPRGVGCDFTIIDGGRVVGITQSFGATNNAAIWFFENPKVSGQYSVVKSGILAACVELSWLLSERPGLEGEISRLAESAEEA